MKFLDLFAGVGGIRLGMEQAGHSCVGWVEWDKFARKSYVAIHKPDGEFTEKDINNVTSQELPKADCWCFGFPCSPAGTKVKTIDGYKNIEDIKKGDLVLTHQGRYQKVIRPMSKIAVAINKINAKGVFNLQLTDNHPLYVYNINTKEFEWVKAAKLNKDIHYLTLNVNTNEDRIALSNDDIWLLGRYVSDGYKSKNSSSYTQFAVRNSKENEFVSHLGGYDYSIYHSDRTAPEYVIKDQRFSNLAGEFGDGAKNKHLSEWIGNAPINQIKVFIDGYLSGDGYISDVRTMWSTVSEELALGLQSLFIKAFHKVPAIYVRHDKRSATFNDTYNSQIHKKDVGTFVVENYMCTKIKNIERTEQPIEVFNMEVENDSSYTLENVIVHNCQDISVAGKQGGFTNGKRSSLFFKVTGLIRELKEEDKPSYLFIENVKNLLSINKGWDFAKLLIEMDEIGYDVEWDVLDSAEVVPQHRERIFIVGHLRGRSTRKVFPIIRKNGQTNKIIKEVARIYPNRHSSDANSVIDPSGISHTVTAHSYKDSPKILVNQLGNISNSKFFGGNQQVGRVHGINGIAPTLSTMQGGGQEPKILDDQGRTKKRLKPLSISPTLRSQSHGNEPKVAVREATKIGYDVAKLGDSINLAQPNSKTRRGRVGHGVANTLTTTVEQATLTDDFKIRKLTPKECWRLQGFPDWAFDKAQEVNSDSQLYKQAGNSVTVPVIYEIAKRLSIKEGD